MSAARISDILLERYLSGDVPAEAKAHIERALQEDARVRERLEILQKERAQFYADDPPPMFAHRVRSRIDHAYERAAAAPAPARWRWLFSPALAAAALIVLVVGVLVQNRERMSAPEDAFVAEAPERAPIALAPEPAQGTAGLAPPAAPAAAPPEEKVALGGRAVSEDRKAKDAPLVRDEHERSHQRVWAGKDAAGAGSGAFEGGSSKAKKGSGPALDRSPKTERRFAEPPPGASLAEPLAPQPAPPPAKPAAAPVRADDAPAAPPKSSETLYAQPPAKKASGVLDEDSLGDDAKNDAAKKESRKAAPRPEPRSQPRTTRAPEMEAEAAGAPVPDVAATSAPPRDARESEEGEHAGPAAFVVAKTRSGTRRFELTPSGAQITIARSGSLKVALLVPAGHTYALITLDPDGGMRVIASPTRVSGAQRIHRDLSAPDRPTVVVALIAPQGFALGALGLDKVAERQRGYLASLPFSGTELRIRLLPE